MDFHSLPRKQLQTLCEKNKIPLHHTNIAAMADALAALDHVEGLDAIADAESDYDGMPELDSIFYSDGEAEKALKEVEERLRLIINPKPMEAEAQAEEEFDIDIDYKTIQEVVRRIKSQMITKT